MYAPQNNIEAMATYEAWLFMLQKFLEKLESRSPIDRMIDDATGFYKQNQAYIIPILEDMRDSLVFLWEDTTRIEKLLQQVTNNL